MGKGAKLKNCILMQDTVIGENAALTSVIADKDCVVSEGTVLTGSDKLPVVIPKGEKV